ncbi:MAG: hypothetical protein JNL02_20580 [Saprospiraceae bacterium]|nr:hypothetical protein [Saprospiraceae bacterium]
MDDRAELRRLTEVLTGPESSPGQWFAASAALYELFLRISGFNEKEEAFRRDVQMPSGKALGPVWAAFCLKDAIRTRIFLRGILKALEAARHRFPGTPIHVLYAGCGPFATLMLPLVPLLKENSAVFTLLDVWPENVQSVKRLIDAFQAESFVREIAVADAVRYRIDPNGRAHVLVMELLQAGLSKEPQVAALANLAPQLLPGGIVLPERIRVNAGLLHPGKDMRRMTDPDWAGQDVFRLLEPGFTLTADPDDWQSFLRGEERIIHLPANRDPAYNRLCLFTALQVYENECVETWESALTQPLLLKNLEEPPQATGIALRYECGVAPGFRFRLL